MSGGAFSMNKAVPIIVVTWILSLVTTLALVYMAPSIFPTIINTGNISDDAVVEDKIADGAIITTKLADGTVTSAKILDGTITATDLSDGSVITLKIADGSITSAKIANGAVTTAKIADGAIISVKLANASVTSEKIADGSVTTSKLDDDAVTTSKIDDDAIVTVKLADGAVTSAKILDGTIIAEDLATNSVSTVKIANGAITTAKIADGAVTNMKLAAYAIPFNSTFTTVQQNKATETWENITGMSVQLTLQRKSTLLIMFSTETSAAAAGVTVIWRVGVNATFADPGAIWAQPADTTGFYWTSVSYNFISNVNAGQFTVYMQWYVYGGDTAYVGARTLVVIALPA